MNAPQTSWYDPQPVKLRVSDFELLHKAGVFEGRYKVELIEGVITAMNAEYRLHGVVKNRLVRRLQRSLEALNSTLEALAEVSLQLTGDSLAQPDAVVTRIALDRRYFAPADVAIAIEVSDSTVRGDLTRKARLYAAAGVPELWIADLKRTQLHQFWAPQDGSYTQSQAAFLLGEVRSLTMPELAISGDGIL